MYYPHSIKTIRDKIGKFKNETSKPELQKDIDHILWMLGQIENMKIDQSAKAGRWIGWIQANLEFIGIIRNQESREMIKIDVMNNND